VEYRDDSYLGMMKNKSLIAVARMIEPIAGLNGIECHRDKRTSDR
jgi:hypothetical protein